MTAATTLRVLAKLHPLNSARTEIELPVGKNLAEIVEVCGQHSAVSSLACRAVVRLNGEPIVADQWRNVRPKAGSHVHVEALAGDFIATPFALAIGKALTLSPFATSVLTAGISTVLSSPLHALLTPCISRRLEGVQ